MLRAKLCNQCSADLELVRVICDTSIIRARSVPRNLLQSENVAIFEPPNHATAFGYSKS